MSSSQPTATFLSRLFKPDPYRELFRALAEVWDKAVLVVSSDGKHILACNHFFLVLTGYSRGELETLAPEVLFPASSTDQPLTRVLADWQEGERLASAVPLLGRDGSTTSVDVHALAVTPGAGVLLLTLQPAGTEQRHEEEREAEKQRLAGLARISRLLVEGGKPTIAAFLNKARHLLNATHLALYRLLPTSPDYQKEGDLPDSFPTQLAASELRPVTGSGSWLRGQRPGHPLHKAARAAGLQALRAIPLGARNAWIGILVATWRDKGAVPTDIDQLLAVVASLGHAAIQLGLQQGAAAELGKTISALESELLDQATVVSEGLLALDGNLRVLRVNRAACQMLGYRENELSGVPIQDVLVGPGEILPTLLDALGHQREAEPAHLKLHRRDGVPFPVELHAIPVEGGATTKLLVALKDQSERQAIEYQAEILAPRALLGEVSAIFAHEVRNPINSINMGVQLLTSRLGKDPDVNEILEGIQKECKRLDQLLTDVLFFSRPMELRIENIDMADLLQRLLARWKPRFEQAHVQCITAFHPDTPTARADPRTFEQVVVNLITNSLDAMPHGGSISFNLSRAETAQGPMVELKVADSGPGIPTDIQERIFDPFFSTKREGTGLGLSITRRIITAHKGSITVESYPTAGTIFTVRVPCAEGKEGHT